MKVKLCMNLGGAIHMVELQGDPRVSKKDDAKHESYKRNLGGQFQMMELACDPRASK